MASYSIAGVQMRVTDTLSENLATIIEHINGVRADFIVFPQMSLTGYHANFGGGAVHRAWDQVAAACRRAYVTAIIGTGCKENGHTYIQTRVYSDQGDLVGTHEKLVPTETDRKFFRPGEELRVFEHGGLSFGCLICNDFWVAPGEGPYPDPRLSYQLGQRGARVVFHSIGSGTNPQRAGYHESNLQLRAKESALYVFTANATEDSGPVNAPTGAVSPEGEWLVRCPKNGEHVYTYDLEID